MSYSSPPSSKSVASTPGQRHAPPSAAALGTSALQLALPPGLPILEDTLKFVSAFAKKRFVSRVAERVAVASYELLGNALDYGRIGHDVAFEIAISEDHVHVRVANTAIAERIDMLRRHLSRLDANAEATFEAEMTRSLKGTGPRAMLGLARIRHEADMALTHTVSDARVTVTASCRR